MIDLLVRPSRFFDRIGAREPARLAPTLILLGTAGSLGLSTAPMIQNDDLPDIATTVISVAGFGFVFLIVVLATIWAPLRFASGKAGRSLETTGYSQVPTLLAVCCALGLERVAPTWISALQIGGDGIPGGLSAVLGAAQVSGVWSLVLVFLGVRSLAPGTEYSAVVALALVTLIAAVITAAFQL